MSKVSLETLSAYVDGDLSSREAICVEAELAQSPSLRRELEEIRNLQSLASRIELEAPPRDLWPNILARVHIQSSWRNWGIWKPLKVRDVRIFLAYSLGAIAVLVLCWGAFSFLGERYGGSVVDSTNGITEARRAYQAAIVAIEQNNEIGGAGKRISDETRLVLEASMVEVDRAIARAEDALTEAPEDMFVHQMLLALYDEKLRILDVPLRYGDDGEGGDND